jgi:hypothetical protein
LQIPPILAKPFIPILVSLYLYALYNQLVRLLKLARFIERSVAVVNQPTLRHPTQHIFALQDWFQNIPVWFPIRMGCVSLPRRPSVAVS